MMLIVYFHFVGTMVCTNIVLTSFYMIGKFGILNYFLSLCLVECLLRFEIVHKER